MRFFGSLILSVFLAAEPVGAQEQRLDSLLADTARTQLFKWCYPGGEAPLGEMRFWSNGLVQLAFPVGDKLSYFSWEFMSADRSELRLTFVDPTYDFESLLWVELTHTYVSGYDEQAKSITYKTLLPTYHGMFFGGWRFAQIDCPPDTVAPANKRLQLALALQVPRSCPPLESEPPRITPDSIAHLPVEAALGTLALLCPVARDTFYSLHPALAFEFEGLEAVALQNRAWFEPDSGADSWIIRGERGVLPGGVPMTATWASLLRNYEGFDISVEDGRVDARLCEYPTIFVQLAVDGESLAAPLGVVEDNQIPMDTRILEVTLLSGYNRRHMYPPQRCR